MKKMMKLISLVIGALLLVSGCAQETKTEEKYYNNAEFAPKNGETVNYETADKCIGWGEYQKEVDKLGSSCVEYNAGYIGIAPTKEAFDEKVAVFKKKLDIIGAEYAFGYAEEKGTTIVMKIDTSKIGLPVFSLFNVSNPGLVKVVSPLEDMEISEIKKLSYSMAGDSKYDITIEISENKQEQLKKYIDENVGGMVYFKMGEITFSSCMITEDTKEDVLTFHSMTFLGKDANEKDYEYILKLAEYIINNPDIDMGGMSFPTEVEDGIEYGVPYVTPLDDITYEAINAVYPDTTLTRRTVKNTITIHFNIDPKAESDEKCLERIKKIFEITQIDKGAYTSVSFTWPTGEGNKNDYVIFIKDDGIMECTGYSDGIESLVKADEYIGKLIK